MTADEILKVAQRAAPTVTGVTIRDLDNVDTWTFSGKALTAQDAQKAVDAIQEARRPKPPPLTIDAVAADLATLKTRVADDVAALTTRLEKVEEKTPRTDSGAVR